jgi:hypothetical protein
MSHLIVSAPQLEAEHGLEVFSLQQDATFQSVAEVDCLGQRRLVDDFVDAGCEDQTKVLLVDKNIAPTVKSSTLTSGKPLGRRNASGIFASAVELFVLDGGEGLAVYSVSDRVLSFGVWGVCVPLGVEFSSMTICTTGTVDSS